VETLKYRYCPHCGAEITAAPAKFDTAMLTIPPDMSGQQSQKRAAVSSPQPDENVAATKSFNDQTVEPQPVVKPSRPIIKPPDTPPPSSFFRTRPEVKEPPAPDVKQAPQMKSRKNTIIVILILLIVVILIMGGVFTF
jgi:hypothetical protein